jgi:hypothetical protein
MLGLEIVKTVIAASGAFVGRSLEAPEAGSRRELLK